MMSVLTLVAFAIPCSPALDGHTFSAQPERPVIHNGVATQASEVDRIVQATYEKKDTS
jgi:hypothetical protein